MGSFDWIADFAGKLPMDVISEMMGVPEADRDEVRRLADLVVHREDGVYDVPPAGDGRVAVALGYYEDMVTQRRRTPTDDLTSALIEAAEDRRRPAHRRGHHRVPLPHGRGRQRDHHQAARQRAVPPDRATPTSSRRSSTDPTRSSSTRGSRRRCATTPPARCWPATSLRDVELHGKVAPAGLEAAALPRLGQPRRAGLLAARRVRHLPRQGRARPDPVLRRRPALLPRRQPGPAGGAGRADSWSSGSARSRSSTTGCVRVHSVNVRGFAALPTTHGGALMASDKYAQPDASPGRRHRRLLRHRRRHRAPPRPGRATRSRSARVVRTSCEELAAQIRADGGEAVAHPLDLTDDDSVDGVRQGGPAGPRRHRGRGLATPARSPRARSRGRPRAVRPRARPQPGRRAPAGPRVRARR